MGQMTKLTLS